MQFQPDVLIRYLQSPWVMAALAGVVLCLLLVPWLMYRRKTAETRLIQKTIEAHSDAYEADAVMSDGIDGFLFVDYLLLLSGRIVAMKVLSKKGYIFGDEKLDEWTCVQNNRTEKFTNPLADVRLCVQQIRHVLGFEHVAACVLFGRDSKFPKGVPEGVLRLPHLEEELIALKGSGDGDAAARKAWAKLIAMVGEGRWELGSDINC